MQHDSAFLERWQKAKQASKGSLATYLRAQHGELVSAESMFDVQVKNLLGWDEYVLLADFASYMQAQAQVDEACEDRARWTRMSILNVARSGKFSSDRAIAEYCRDIRRAAPVPAATATWIAESSL